MIDPATWGMFVAGGAKLVAYRDLLNEAEVLAAKQLTIQLLVPEQPLDPPVKGMLMASAEEITTLVNDMDVMTLASLWGLKEPAFRKGTITKYAGLLGQKKLILTYETPASILRRTLKGEAEVKAGMEQTLFKIEAMEGEPQSRAVAWVNGLFKLVAKKPAPSKSSGFSLGIIVALAFVVLSEGVRHRR